jgi:FimV-like protein
MAAEAPIEVTDGVDSSAPVEAAPAVNAVPPRVVATPTGSIDGEGNYGPVQRGETLWGISRSFARGQGYSVNQVMLAIQQQNPGAFNKDNIHSLKAGSVLRMPTREQVLAFEQRSATLEVQRQELVYRGATPESVALSAEELPLVASLESADQDVSDRPLPDEAIAGLGDGEVRLELVPPAEGDADQGELGTGNTGDETEDGAISVAEELARTEEELANARQQNSYLSEKIEELEAELARRETGEGDTAAIADTGLAQMEEQLREQRLDETPEEVVIIPPAEQRPGLARFTPWALGVLLVVVLGVVAWMRKRAASRDEEAMQGITEEAEDILRVLETESPADATANSSIDGKPLTPAPLVIEEAVELDADDPETKLDLARAYLSMGDRKAAQDILEEVLAIGNEEQVEEARDMLREL